MMRVFKSTLVAFFCFALVSCAPLVTKPELPELKELPPLTSKPTVQYRFYERTPSNRGNGVRFNVDEAYERAIVDALNTSTYFSSLERYPTSLAHVQFQGSNSDEDEELLLKVKYPLNVDYLINVEAVGIDYGPHGNMYLGLLHLLSLGFIPMKMNNDANLKMTIFNKNGDIVFENDLKQESSIWAWTPLFFFNGFRLFASMDKLAKPNRENTLRYMLKKLAESKKL